MSMQPVRRICHEFFANILSWAIDYISVVCKHVEICRIKRRRFSLGKRRLFSRKRRVSDAKTKSFESKDFVFFRKDAVFFVGGLETFSENCYFDWKPAQNTEKIPSESTFCILSSPLVKQNHKPLICWNNNHAIIWRE